MSGPVTDEPQSSTSHPGRRSLYPLPDALLFLFLLCIARQYLWILGGSVVRNVIAYAVSALVAGIVVGQFSVNRGMGWEGTESALEPGWHLWRTPKSADHDLGPCSALLMFEMISCWGACHGWQRSSCGPSFCETSSPSGSSEVGIGHVGNA